MSNLVNHPIMLFCHHIYLRVASVKIHLPILRRFEEIRRSETSSTRNCDVTMNDFAVPCIDKMREYSIGTIHRLPKTNVSTISSGLMRRNFSSVSFLLTFNLCQSNVMILLNHLSGAGPVVSIRKWQDYVYIQCEYKSTKQKIKHLLREENKVKENKIS